MMAHTSSSCATNAWQGTTSAGKGGAGQVRQAVNGSGGCRGHGGRVLWHRQVRAAAWSPPLLCLAAGLAAQEAPGHKRHSCRRPPPERRRPPVCSTYRRRSAAARASPGAAAGPAARPPCSCAASGKMPTSPGSPAAPAAAAGGARAMGGADRAGCRASGRAASWQPPAVRHHASQGSTEGPMRQYRSNARPGGEQRP